ncbi:MAG: hypothetical protein WC072_08555 [Methanoregulaceae archaeon]
MSIPPRNRGGGTVIRVPIITSGARCAMPVIDPNSIEVLREKVDAWREVEQENLSRYCEILDLLLKIEGDMDGHPAQAVSLLGDVRGTVLRLEGSISSECSRKVQPPPLKWYQSPLFLVGMTLVSGVVSSLLTLLLTGRWPS